MKNPIPEKAMPYIKIGAVILYFILVMLRWGGTPFFMWDEENGGSFFFMEMIQNIILLYSFTWLYRLVVDGAYKGMKKKSALFVSGLLGFWALLQFLYIVFSGGAQQAYQENILYFEYIVLIYMIAINLTGFFLFGGRKISLNKKDTFQAISILLLILIAICIVIIFILIRPVSPLFPEGMEMDPLYLLNLFQNGLPSSKIGGILHKTETIMGLALFFLLWINTKPREKNKLQEKQGI